MKQQDYQCGYTVAMSPDEVLEHIANVPAWWVRNTEGSAKSLHDVFTVRFPGGTHVTFEITEYVPGMKVVWSVTDCYLPWLQDKHEWTGTSVAWTVQPVAEGTKVSMTHNGLHPQVECYEGCRKGWDQYAGQSLHKYITEQVGMPQ